MPFKSEAQRRFFEANKKTIGESVVDKWNKETGKAKLPDHVKPATKNKYKK